MRYLVYNNPEGDNVDFVRNEDGSPKIFDDLGEAEDCMADQENGYIVPMGWDPIDALTRLRDMGVQAIAWQQEGKEPTDQEINALIEASTELAKELADVISDPELENAGTGA